MRMTSSTNDTANHDGLLSKARIGYTPTDAGVIPQDWNCVELDRVLRLPLQNGVFNAPGKKGRGVHLINVIDLYHKSPIDDRNLSLYDASDSELKTFGVRCGDIFFTRSSLTPDGIAHCNVWAGDGSQPVVFDCHIIRACPDPHKADGFFLFRYCTSASARKYLIANAQTTTMTTVGQGVIRKLPIALPPLPEQRAIAAALSDVDELIGALDKLIAKKRAIKLATMQQLLTGNTRLPGFETVRGWKHTTIGDVPKDWIVTTIGEVCQIFGRIGFRGYTKADIVEKGNGAIALSPSNIEQGRMVYDNCTYLSWPKYEESPEIKIRNGDILLVKTGSTFGKTAIVQHLKEKATLNPQVVVLKKRKVDDFFLGYTMGFDVIQDQINSTIVGGALPTLSQKVVSGFQLAIPPSTAEQAAIGTVLSDMDAEIAALEQRREKTKAIKQGMMQSLLTGRVRLVKPEGTP